ncbi:MAG: hypothetical protein HC888_04725 [Candidatus Competibacteraceae bacterium]|nr:hypothetical protein [Candidatus Competibacteraceae bacterium]
MKELFKNMKYIEFTKVFRQDNAAFLELLDKCRKATVTNDDLSVLDECVWIEGKEIPEDMLILTTRRREALRMNTDRYNSIERQEFTYNCNATGRYLKATDDDRLPAPKTLRLKVGTRVMFTVNEAGGEWVNGTRAIVTKLMINAFSQIRAKERRRYSLTYGQHPNM